MEIFMRNIPYTADEISVTLRLESILHNPPFDSLSTSPGLPINFKVSLFRDRKGLGRGHNGCGSLTLPAMVIGKAFLASFGGPIPSSHVAINGRNVNFSESRNKPRPDILGEVQLMPYRDPRAIQERERRLANLSGLVKLQDVQLAWMCRDGTLSIEWRWNWRHWEELSGVIHQLRFNDDSREMIVEKNMEYQTHRIAMRWSCIRFIEVDKSPEPSILLWLDIPPSFEVTQANQFNLHDLFSFNLRTSKRQKLSHLNDEHALVLPYTWNLLRLVCRSHSDLAEFKRMAEVADLPATSQHYTIESRGLFSSDKLGQLQEWLSSLDGPRWPVAFQCAALLHDQLLDVVELLHLRPRIERLMVNHDPSHAARVLRQFGLYLRKLLYGEVHDSVESCFDRAKVETAESDPALTARPTDGLFPCLHVDFTPTAMTLRGPFPDTSNRILRRYADHQDCFLRVTFTDEERLKFRFDRKEVDGPQFIQTRVGTLLRKGFTLCGRKFEFLAYSQSALKQYTVWFVTPFIHNNRYVNAESIRGSIGTRWNHEVRRCPARFAARLSQAFTATESSIFVEPDQVERIPDIERNGFCFSDGNGSLSQEMANAIHNAMQRGSGRSNRNRRVPSVFQIRIQGAKGVLSVNPTLSGLQIRLRPSMIKFESLGSHEIEVARAFNKPGKLFLNRPLVMILSSLGVATEVFLKLQRNAVEETEEASRTFKGAAKLLEMHGLGTAFAVPSTLLNLRKLGLDWVLEGDQPSSSRIKDPFVERAMRYAVNHVLREMKYRARIPVPDSWKLVGVVDVHNTLEPNQIYACIVRGQDAKAEYLEGHVLVSKSPTIHPGDVQIAQAIGAPPASSPLRALTNCVVFSQRGDRPLPNKLSGSDLDGDEYDVITLHELHPEYTVLPGEYPPAPKRLLERDSTIEDVADFVVDFINNDMLGIIATNFLLIADQRTVFNEECLKLAELHSWAVDFAKNGVPVPPDNIPQPDIRVKPDWSAPEVANVSQDGRYYESQSVIGKLFRDIKLPTLSATNRDHHGRKRLREQRNAASLSEAIEGLSLGSSHLDDPISTKLRRRLHPLVDLVHSEELRTEAMALFDHFAAELEYICFSKTLSRKATSRLSEEEVFIGTIIAKTAQPRMRNDTISEMRAETTALALRIWKELEGNEESPVRDWVNRAYAAWSVSVTKSREGVFAAQSFGWVALRALFDGIGYLERD